VCSEQEQGKGRLEDMDPGSWKFLGDTWLGVFGVGKMGERRGGEVEV
jgi:hypothetical protein